MAGAAPGRWTVRRSTSISQPGTTFADAVRVAGVARELLDDPGITGYPKTSGNRGIHIYVRIRPEWEFTDVRHAAIGFGRELEKRDSGVTTAVVEGGARRAHLCRLQPELPRPDDRLGLPTAPAPARRCRRRCRGPNSPVWDPAAYNLFTVPDRLTDGDPWVGIDDVAHSIEPLLRRHAESGLGEMPFPPDHPKMPGEPPRVQPSKKVAAHGLGGQPHPGCTRLERIRARVLLSE